MAGTDGDRAVTMALSGLRHDRRTLLAVGLAGAVGCYLAWKISESPEQAVQFTYNGLAVGAIYAILALGFTVVYSTVWYFDMYYAAAAAIGAYGVFYLRSPVILGGQYEANSVSVNTLFAVVAAGVVSWVLHERLAHRRGVDRSLLTAATTAGGLAAGLYVWYVLRNPADINVTLSPALGVIVAALVFWVVHRAAARIRARGLPLWLGAACGLILGGWASIWVAGSTGSALYLSWGFACLLAGLVGVALYRGLYVYMERRARSPLVMIVGSLGVLLAVTAATTIVFEGTPRPLPEPFGNDPWTIASGHVRGFSVFAMAVAVGSFVGLLLLLKHTSFGKAVRAIGDDLEVAKVVGLNTTAVIATVFFIGAVFAAAAGILSGHETAIQPRMGLPLLLKGWIASVVGGLGSLHGALVGGFALGIIEQFGIWDLAGEWRDVISFVVLILFLSFWPKGLLPRT